MAKEDKTLFVKSAVKDLIKSKGCKTSSEVVDKGALQDLVKEAIVKACARAKDNKRVTVMPQDL